MKHTYLVSLGCAWLALFLAGCPKSTKEQEAELLALMPGAAGSAQSAPPASSGATSTVKGDPAACKQCKERETDVKSCGTTESLCGSLTGVAAEGPGKGVEKKKLCEEALTCMRSKCGDAHESYCLCGDAGCVQKGADGPCLKELMAAFESPDYMSAGARFSDRQYAGGVAVGYHSCVNHRCRGVCDY